MKICRYDDDRVGVVVGDEVFDVTQTLAALPALLYPVPPGDALIAALADMRPRFDAAAAAARGVALANVSLLSPVANPSKIVGAPVNYALHLDEVLGDQQIHHGQQIKPIERVGLFLKSSSSLVGAGQGVALRFPDRRNDHEVELAVIIGTRADRVSRHKALDFVAGYAIGLDITVRGPEERSLRKSVDSYSVLGPWLVTADELANPSALDLSITVNGEARQRSNTKHLIFDVPRLIEYASSFYTLHPGDVIMTGTPEGVGPIAPGDVMEASVEGVGAMRVAVRGA